MLDENGDALILPIRLDQCLRRCKLIYQISPDTSEEIGRDCSCPVITLCSAHEHTIRLACDRNELFLHLALDFRSLGRQSKSENVKNHTHRHDQDT